MMCRLYCITYIKCLNDYFDQIGDFKSLRSPSVIAIKILKHVSHKGAMLLANDGHYTFFKFVIAVL